MKNILLGCCASVSVYKACDLASKLTQAGFAVRTVLTPNAAKLVHPQLFEAVTGNSAQTSEWGEARDTSMDHIALARWADVFLIAPATANFLARASHGEAEDLLSTVVLALEPSKPRIICPAMNPVMLGAAPVQRNLVQLRTDGWQILEPGEGHMACGEAGKGRLAEPVEILEFVQKVLA